MEKEKLLNDLLVMLFNEVLDMEHRVLITGSFKEISINDMHIIDAVGIREPRNMSTVAKAVSVTVGTLTTAINNLVKKGYVKRARSEEDRRVVLISLSSKGKRAFDHHEKFHDEMIKATLDGLNQEQTKILVKALKNLSKFFREYGDKH